MNTAAIPTLKRKTTVKEQAYSIIKELILTQKYQLGEKINIDTLADSMNVSNSPIREALTMLEKRGLVENVPNVGFRVISFSPTAYREVCLSLLVIVSGAYDLCLRQNTIEQTSAKMHEILELQKQSIDNADMLTSVKYALSFDKCMVEGTDNHHLLSIYEQIEDLFFLMALHSHQRDTIEHKKNIYEHSMILEMIDRGDTAAVKEWLYSHYNKEI